MKKELYPYAQEIKAYKKEKPQKVDRVPDFIGNKPNYDKFPGRDIENILTWLNID